MNNSVPMMLQQHAGAGLGTLPVELLALVSQLFLCRLLRSSALALTRACDHYLGTRRSYSR